MKTLLLTDAKFLSKKESRRHIHEKGGALFHCSGSCKFCDRCPIKFAVTSNESKILKVQMTPLNFGQAGLIGKSV